MKYPIYLFLSFSIIIFSCSSEEQKSVQVEKAIEVVVDEEAEEIRKEEIEQEIEELGLDEAEQEEVKEQMRLEEEERNEKIAKSPLVELADNPDGFLEDFSARIEKAGTDCNIPELKTYMKECGEDPIFRSFLKSLDFEDRVYVLYDRADEVIDNCTNP